MSNRGLFICKGVESITKAMFHGKLKYEIKLEPNYSFSSNGTQIQYCNKDEIENLLNEVVFCDGETIQRSRNMNKVCKGGNK